MLPLVNAPPVHQSSNMSQSNTPGNTNNTLTPTGPSNKSSTLVNCQNILYKETFVICLRFLFAETELYVKIYTSRTYKGSVICKI